MPQPHKGVSLSRVVVTARRTNTGTTDSVWFCSVSFVHTIQRLPVLLHALLLFLFRVVTLTLAKEDATHSDATLWLY